MASLTNEDVKHIVDQLKVCHCGKCGQILKDPKILACAHSVCSSCIDLELIEDDKFPCPVCGHLTDEPHSLKGNQFVSLLFETLNSIDKKPFCQWCESKGDIDTSADFTCIDCSMNLCSACNQLHSSCPPFKDHKVVDSTDRIACEKESAVQEDFCKKHPQKKNEVFCKKCHQFLCVLCSVVNSTHPDDLGQKHDCIEISDIMQTDRDKLKKNIRAMKSQISTLRGQVKSMHDDHTKMRNSRISIERNFSNESVAMYNKITKKYTKLMKDVADIFDPREATFFYQLQKLDERMDLLSTQISKSLYGLKYHPAAPLHKAVLESTTAAKDEMQNTKLSFKDVTYEPSKKNTIAQTTMDEHFGNIVEHTLLEDAPALKHRNDVAYSDFTHSYYVAGGTSGLWASNCGQLKKVHDKGSYGLCTSANGQLLYSTAGGNKVNVFKLSPMKNPKLERTLELEGAEGLQSLCIAEDGRIAVMDFVGKKVFIIGKEEQVEQELENIFNGNVMYGAWIGDDELCASVKVDKKLSKVMAVNTKRSSILWEVEFTTLVWTVSYVGHLVYISYSPAKNSVRVMTKKGVIVGEVCSPDGSLMKVIQNNNNRSVVKAVSLKQI